MDEEHPLIQGYETDQSSVAADLFAQSAGQTPFETDDAYHFKYWQPSAFNAFYTEWWYFNFYDEKDDLEAIFFLQVADPSDVTRQGAAISAAVVYQGSKVIRAADLYPLSSFSASYSQPDVTLGSNTLLASDLNNYRLSGASRDGRLSWNLFYLREASSWYAGNRVNVAPAVWQQMSWLIDMPRARVVGTLTVDGQIYSIDAPGYHDHNWGQWNFSGVNWNWAQYSQPGLAFDLGDFPANSNGRARITVDGKTEVFSTAQYSLVHTKWAFDPRNRKLYPTQSLFTARNEEARVTITMDVLKNEGLPAGPLPSLVIYEQPAHFSGSVTFSEDATASPVTFSGKGFKEFTAVSTAP